MKILATAYAVNPFKGSEDGMGWNFILQIARHQQVIAITRENNEIHIIEGLKKLPEDLRSNIRFEYFDLPYWMRFWKKGGRGAMLYFYLWQLFIPFFILRKKFDFDIVHNLNFHNDWTPSFLWILGKPLVWGPVGHHPLIPKAFLNPYGLKALLKDRVTWILKQLFWKIDPFVKITARKSRIILAMNSSVKHVLGLDSKKVRIMPSVATNDFFREEIIKNQDSFNVLTVGRLVPLKGMDVSIRAFAAFMKGLNIHYRQKSKLTIVGNGPELEVLKQLANNEGVNRYVEFVPWMDREKLFELYNTSHAFLFPSHEGAGMVVAEALSAGLPVLAFDNCGPGEFINEKCGFKIPYAKYHASVHEFSNALNLLFFNKKYRDSQSLEAKKQYQTNFSWDSRGEALKKVYHHVELNNCYKAAPFHTAI